LQFDITQANDDAYTLTVNGTQLSYQSDASATTTEIQEGLAAQINALGIEGLTVDTGTTDKLILRNENPFTSITATADSDVSANFVAETNDGATVAGGDANALQTLAQRATAIDFSATAAIEEGRGFRITVGTDSFTYVAGKGETTADVARGLKTAIDSAGVTGVTAEVQFDADTNVWSLAVDDATGGQAIDIVANDGAGTASGGLFGLD
ncbi:MAG: flagellin, partial [Pseudomonadota bacterium]